MIKVHRLNKTQMYINANHIESIEATPDTILTLSNEKKVIVRETVDEIINSIIQYHQTVFQNPSKLVKQGDLES